MSNETAGEHYTPREVIRLMVNLLFAEHQDELKGKGIVRSVYDPACGTGGMLTIANDHIQTIIEAKDSNIWIGTLGGLLRFWEGEMTQYDEAEGLDYKAIHALVEDKNGDILVGTFGGGLYKLDNSTTIYKRNICCLT